MEKKPNKRATTDRRFLWIGLAFITAYILLTPTVETDRLREDIAITFVLVLGLGFLIAASPDRD